MHNFLQESLMEKNDKKQKVKKIISILRQLFPNSKIVLKFSNPWELYVAVVLSAQTTDKKVNEVTEKLFQKYNTLSDYIHATPQEFQNDIRQIGLFRNKAKNILASAKMVDEEYDGQIPDSMEELLKLPGVGRKTANILLGNLYQKYEGIAVDTHVQRLSQLFGLTKEKDPNKIEKDLMEIVPRKDWFNITYLLIDYGRAYCPAHCKHVDCPLREFMVSK